MSGDLTCPNTTTSVVFSISLLSVFPHLSISPSIAISPYHSVYPHPWHTLFPSITPSRKVIMATNRIESLDPALIRPGRIDRKIEFPLPGENTAKRNSSNPLLLTHCFVSPPLLCRLLLKSHYTILLLPTCRCENEAQHLQDPHRPYVPLRGRRPRGVRNEQGRPIR